MRGVGAGLPGSEGQADGVGLGVDQLCVGDRIGGGVLVGALIVHGLHQAAGGVAVVHRDIELTGMAPEDALRADDMAAL